MNDYTPTTEAIRGRIIQRGIGWGFYGLDEFDRWLAAHDAAKRAEWEAEQGETEWEYEATPDWVEGIRWSGKSLDEHLSNLDRYSDPNGGWWYGEKENKPDRITYQVRRRRKAGPWIAVPDTTNNESEGEA